MRLSKDIEVIVNSSTSTATAQFHNKNYGCVIGKNGMIAANKKIEGDGKTPIGRWRLKKVFFREDKVEKPLPELPVEPIQKNYGWCDDINCKDYNKLVILPHSGSYEDMWRDDSLYDIVVELAYNDSPIVKGQGSAIFMHIMRDNGKATEGCIALKKESLLEILRKCSKNTHITIS